ncbi:MAG: urate oxidase [Acidobacteriota bacterium]
MFASGPKRNYYGKGDVIVYRLNRDGKTPSGQSPVLGASLLMLLYGDSFWPTYTTGDNTGLIATDSMKNFMQRETMNYAGPDLEAWCRFLGEKFIAKYPQVEGLEISAVEIPYRALSAGGAAFAPTGPDRAWTRIEINRTGMVDVVSGLRDYRLLRLGGSAFMGFVRDEYTTLPDIHNRPLHMGLDLEWSSTTPEAAFTEGRMTADVRTLVREIFEGFESGSIQQIIYQMGTAMLERFPAISEVRLEATNRTWDTIAEQGDELGVYTDARPPFGCLGLTLTRG